MGIEKDINQSRFRNDYQKAGINLIYTYNWMTEKMKLLFEKYGLTPQQFNILRILLVPVNLFQLYRYGNVCWIK